MVTVKAELVVLEQVLAVLSPVSWAVVTAGGGGGGGGGGGVSMSHSGSSDRDGPWI
jgi:hypothetical protein